MPKPSRSHKVIVTVTFNRPTTPAKAARMFADNIHGEFYTAMFWEDRKAPDTFKVRSVKPAPAQVEA